MTALPLEGFLLLDKPAGMTSYDCIENNLKVLAGKNIRIGYAGTLDAFATGLLIIGFGRAATAMIDQIMQLDKTYLARAKWGELTDTLDCTGTQQISTLAPLDLQALRAAGQSLGAGYRQVPPLYSALKHQGRRLSDLARHHGADSSLVNAIAGHKARHIDIFKLEILPSNDSFFSVRAHVSHGTYIRSLVNDIAVRAAGCATTHQLRREQIGPFDIADATSLSALHSSNDIAKRLIGVPQMDKLIKEYIGHQNAAVLQSKLEQFKKSKKS